MENLCESGSRSTQLACPEPYPERSRRAGGGKMSGHGSRQIVFTKGAERPTRPNLKEISETPPAPFNDVARRPGLGDAA
jgi:hypothetical protein